MFWMMALNQLLYVYMLLLMTLVMKKKLMIILLEMKMFIVLIKEKGIIPIISLPTLRADKYSQAINILNGRLVELCKTQGVYHIEHRDIRREHLNQGGLHMSKFNYLLNRNFSNCFNYLLAQK